jgi:hypothetical protein
VSPAILIRVSAFCACLLPWAGAAWAAPADSAHSFTVQPAALEGARRWFPVEVALGPQAGAQLSRLRATSEYRSLLEPVPERERPWIRPSFGGFVSARWANGFSLTLAPRREYYGLRTVEDTVSFAGNPYPHTLAARTGIDCNVWPLLAGFGRSHGRHRARIQAGLYQAFISDFGLAWIVDGEPSARRPKALPSSSFAGGMLAVEYGFGWGPGEWIAGLEYERAFDSALYGLEGSVRVEALQIRLGYAWAVWRRGP